MIKSIEQEATAMKAAAIAKHLNIAESAIVKIEEWKYVLFVVVSRLGARFVSKKVVKMPEKPKTKSLFEKNDAVLKPQNRFSGTLKNEIANRLTKWLIDHEYAGYHARLLANHLCQEAIDARIASTSSRAPQVFFSDKEKIESVVLESKKLAQKLEKSNQIDETLEKLESLDSLGEGNSL